MRIFLSTADASGDLHAAALLESLRSMEPGLTAFGLGGERVAASPGFEPVVRQEELAVAGLVEVLGHAPQLLAGYVRLRRAIQQDAPDLCVFVDSPDLNLPLAAVARRAGARVAYYVTPQVWAWRYGRVRKLRRRVDHALVIFPFEEPLLRAAGVPTTFVGHPLVERLAGVREKLDPRALATEFGLDPARPVLGILPGSRRNELASNLELFVRAASLAREAEPTLQVVLPLAATVRDTPLALPEFVRVLEGRSHDAMALSTALVVAPGTATIEAALLGVPMVVAHRLNRLSFGVARRVSRVASSCMVNLIAERSVVPELLQERAEPAAIAATVGPLLGDPSRREAMRADLASVCEQLGGPGASDRAAEIVLKLAR